MTGASPLVPTSAPLSVEIPALSLEYLPAALADRYRIERKLGGGGMPRVVAARELSLNRDVVIKVVSAKGSTFGQDQWRHLATAKARRA